MWCEFRNLDHIGPRQPEKGDPDDQLSVRRPSADLGNPGRSSGLSPLRLPARRDARDPCAATAADPSGRDRKNQSVLWGSVVGAPIPMCSCGVLPTALGLRKQGATPGATVAFLVATPETGVDSIGLTYALTDPVMTVFRPISGVATAIAAGLATNLFGAPALDSDRAAARGLLHSGRGRRAMSARGGSGGHDDAHNHDHHHDHVQGANSDRGASRSVVDTTRRITITALSNCSTT